MAPTKSRTRATRRGAAKKMTRVVRATAKRAMADNGLLGRALSAGEIPSPRVAGRVAGRVADRPSYARAVGVARGLAAPAAASPRALATLDPEAAARHYLDQAMAPAAPAAGMARRGVARTTAGTQDEFRSLGAEAVALTGTTMVKYRQTFNKIPVYGSLVTVELDEKNRCVGINSSTGAPTGVGSIARIAPAKALAVAAKAAGQSVRALTSTPILYYYFRPDDSSWRLAYIVENVEQKVVRPSKDGRRDAPLKDFVVDANSGKLLAELPRTPTMAARKDVAKDGTGANRSIVVEVMNSGGRELKDLSLNLRTCDFGFRDPWRQSQQLPGDVCKAPPEPWSAEAVAAHFNSAEVARFLRDVLKRNNIDNRGGEMLSSVNCWDRDDGTTPARQWKNAYWNGKQMVYGQIKYPNGSFYSIANMLDVVGHEMFHGVTDNTSRLEYRTQPGALNESYSDIFGTIIANAGKPIDRWTWELGNGFDGPGTALRNLRDPHLHDQPKHMRDFLEASPPYNNNNDYGHVHDNSGIHNYAAYRVMTAKNGSRYMFTPLELAALFYVALTQHLSRTSLFVDSRRAVVQAARSLFRNDTASVRDRKIKAVEDGFAAAGIR